MHAWGGSIVLLQICGILAYLASVQLLDDGPLQDLLTELMTPLLGTLGIVLIARTAFAHQGRLRRAWGLIGLGFGVLELGSVLWLYYKTVLGIPNPVGTLSDAVALAAYPIIVAGLLSFPLAVRNRVDAAKLWLDTLTVGVGAAMVIWYFVLYPSYAANWESPFIGMVVLAFPIGDLMVMFGIASILLRRREGTVRDPLLVLALGMGFFVVADLLYGLRTLDSEYATGDGTDLFWIVGIAVMSMAAELARRSAAAPASADRAGARPFSWLPYGSIVLGYGMMAFVLQDQVTTRLSGLVVGAVVMTIIVVSRQVLAARENEELLAERSARESEERISELMRSSSDIISVVDAHGTILFQSSAGERLAGHPSGALVGTSLFAQVHPDDRLRAREYIVSALNQRGISPAIEWRIAHQDGRWLDVEVIGNNPPGNRLHGIVITARDITERKALEAQLAHQAFHDPLTGLANRALFRSHLESALLRSRRTGETVALLLLDLDNFKNVNDSLGHDVGDQLLIEVAARVQASVRSGDLVARLGGDELAVLLPPPADADEAHAVAERLLAALRAPLTPAGREVFVTASIGIALNGAAGQSVEEMLRDADVAMYRAKGAGRNRIVLFEPEMHAQALRRLEREAELRSSVDQQGFAVYYQPIVCLEDERIAGFEALVRWQHPVLGLVGPGEFIDLAEETGLIVPIGRDVLRAACQAIRAWNDDSPRHAPLFVAVNLSVHQLEQPDIVDDVRLAIEESGVDPAWLTLEITESAMLRDSEATVALLTELKRLGVRLAMDDFGTGYSSLSYLQRLPLDIVKIDKAFVDDIHTGARPAALARVIVTMAETLRMETIAEGVECVEQLACVRRIGSTYYQGYYYARPLPAAEAGALLAERRPARALALSTT